MSASAAVTATPRRVVIEPTPRRPVVIAPIPRRYLTPQEAAEYLRVGYSTLNIHRLQGTGPAYIQWSPMNVRYDIQELDRWLAACVKLPTPAAPCAVKRPRGRPPKQQSETARLREARRAGK
jgi:hypothetical protein